MDSVDPLDGFEAERPRLQRIAARILGDADAAQDVVQQAWLRLHATSEPIDNLPGWLTTVTSRLCLDRLRARPPVPTETIEVEAPGARDPAEDLVLADTVGIALQVVLDRLTPPERVAFVLHDSFGVEFDLIAAMLDTTPVAARKLASRARAKVRPAAPEDSLTDWEVVDAFMAAAREGDFRRLLELLAPDVVVSADEAASALGTPTHLQGAAAVAGFFNGAAAAAFPVFVEDRPGAAWINRGEIKVAFDFTVEAGQVRRLQFRAADDVLAGVRRREGGSASMSRSRITASLDDLPRIGAPATRALNNAGYTALRQLADVPRSELARLHGMGPKALRIIDDELHRHGLRLA